MSISPLKKALLTIFICICFIFGGWHLVCIYNTTIYQTYNSPDGRFKIIVYRRPMIFSSIGGGGDAPGYVQLIDENGKVLKEEKVDMVQGVDNPWWDKNSVSIRYLFTEWDLPVKSKK